MRFFIELAYDGTNYAGWQRQPNAVTVQGELERALKVFTKSDIALHGCGRTDKGVHATFYIAHCDLEIDLSEVDHTIYKLNHLLPEDISCRRFIKVNDDAHARFDPTARSYTYSIHLFKDPFLKKYSTYVSYGKKLDYQLLDEVAIRIAEAEDFTSFCKMHGSDTSMRCEIQESKWHFGEDKRLYYKITANRFLRGMVRLIVGTSLSVASGKMTIDELEKHMSAGTRGPHMSSARAEGLALTDVQYPYL